MSLYLTRRQLIKTIGCYGILFVSGNIKDGLLYSSDKSINLNDEKVHICFIGVGKIGIHNSELLKKKILLVKI
ncbi:MAG: hypothetical protein HQK76_19820 [Desulfobacterales bacterium]|nr:hypothetical protein [Desulfobacterales bacterium]